MPPGISINLEQLAQLTSGVFKQSTRLAPIRPATPLNVTALGLKLAMRIQWSKVDNATGYNIAVMDDNNLNAPILILVEPGSQSMEKIYYTGDVAITRQFAVQAFTDYAGGRIVSEYSELKSATSKVDGGASDSAPTSPPSNPSLDTPESPEATDTTSER